MSGNVSHGAGKTIGLLLWRAAVWFAGLYVLLAVSSAVLADQLDVQRMRVPPGEYWFGRNDDSTSTQGELWLPTVGGPPSHSATYAIPAFCIDFDRKTPRPGFEKDGGAIGRDTFTSASGNIVVSRRKINSPAAPFESRRFADAVQGPDAWLSVFGANSSEFLSVQPLDPDYTYKITVGGPAFVGIDPSELMNASNLWSSPALKKVDLAISHLASLAATQTLSDSGLFMQIARLGQRWDWGHFGRKSAAKTNENESYDERKFGATLDLFVKGYLPVDAKLHDRRDLRLAFLTFLHGRPLTATQIKAANTVLTPIGFDLPQAYAPSTGLVLNVAAANLLGILPKSIRGDDRLAVLSIYAGNRLSADDITSSRDILKGTGFDLPEIPIANTPSQDAIAALSRCLSNGNLARKIFTALKAQWNVDSDLRRAAEAVSYGLLGENVSTSLTVASTYVAELDQTDQGYANHALGACRRSIVSVFGKKSRKSTAIARWNKTDNSLTVAFADGELIDPSTITVSAADDAGSLASLLSGVETISFDKESSVSLSQHGISSITIAQAVQASINASLKTSLSTAETESGQALHVTTPVRDLKGNGLDVTVLNLSTYGDAILIGTKDDLIVIDTGKSRDLLQRLGPYLKAAGGDAKPALRLVITHTHADHIGGLRALLDQGYRVKELIMGRSTGDSQQRVAAIIAKILEDRDVRTMNAESSPNPGVLHLFSDKAGEDSQPLLDLSSLQVTADRKVESWTLRQLRDLQLRIHHYADAKEPNEGGLLVKLNYRGMSWLFADDLDPKAMAAFSQLSDSELRSGWLKWPHHLYYSSKESERTPLTAFLQKVRPHTILFSNKGHSSHTLEQYDRIKSYLPSVLDYSPTLHWTKCLQSSPDPTAIRAAKTPCDEGSISIHADMDSLRALPWSGLPDAVNGGKRASKRA